MCKHCHKGLCAQCLTVTTGGVACTGACSEIVTKVDNLVRRNVTASRSKVGLITPVFLVLIGVFFMYLGFQYLNEGINRMFFLPIVGALLICWGVAMVIVILKRVRQNNQ